MLFNNHAERYWLHTQNNEWSEEELKQAKYCRDDLGFFKSPNEMHIHEDEYPKSK